MKLQRFKISESSKRMNPQRRWHCKKSWNYNAHFKNCWNEWTARNDTAKSRETAMFQNCRKKGGIETVKTKKLILQKLVKMQCTQIVETNERERPKWHCKNSWNGKVCVIWQNQVKMWRKNRKLALVKAEVIISRLLRWFLYFLTIHWPRSSSGTKNSDVNLLAICNYLRSVE